MDLGEQGVGDVLKGDYYTRSYRKLHSAIRGFAIEMVIFVLAALGGLLDCYTLLPPASFGNLRVLAIEMAEFVSATLSSELDPEC